MIVTKSNKNDSDNVFSIFKRAIINYLKKQYPEYSENKLA